MNDESTRLPIRQTPAHCPPVQRHNRPIIVYLTACTDQRRPILPTQEVHRALKQVWLAANAWAVGYYMIMPDHVHMFCAPASLDFPDIRQWSTYWRRLLARQCPELKGIWQPDCWDTQMRSQQHYSRKLDYACWNPVRQGLAKKPEDWPFQGCLDHLPWIL